MGYHSQMPDYGRTPTEPLIAPMSSQRSRVVLLTALILSVTIASLVAAMVLIADSEAERALTLGTALGLVLLALGIWVAAVVSSRLFVPIGDDGQDVSQLATRNVSQRSDATHHQAAPSSSDIFVRLTRRNLSLVERQLCLIDSLEMVDQDPEQLSQLFEVDNLVTQMRRNTESLLVLAAATNQRDEGPVDLVDVVKIAIGQVEEYDRVELGDIGLHRVDGEVAATVAHLLSELLDIALRTSADAAITVSGVSASDNSVEIDISSGELLLSRSQMEAATRTFANHPALELASSDSLGLAVARNLAHHLNVGLAVESTSHGATSLVCQLPSSVLTSTSKPLEVFDQDSALGSSHESSLPSVPVGATFNKYKRGRSAARNGGDSGSYQWVDADELGESDVA